MPRLAAWLILAATLLQAQSGIEGSWQGELKTPGAALRVRINITQEAMRWKGTLDSLDQGANGIPLDAIQWIARRLSWKIPALTAAYEGTLNEAGDTLTGQFTQGGASLPLELKRLSANTPEPAAPKRPQTPKPPFPYTAEDVTFPSKDPKTTLAGTLTIPQGKGPFPALILVTGSGPQDRDETLVNHKPFAVIADHLARRGVAVLRYDDRGIGKSTGQFRGATSADFALDAEGVFDYLRTRPEFNQVGIGGHSEGGIVAPMVAARRKEVAFIVMLAGTGVTGEQVMIRQAAAVLHANGASDDAIAANTKAQAVLLALVRANTSEEEMLRQAHAQLGASPAIDQEIKMVSEPWFRYFLSHDPAPILQKVTCPVLVLNGDLDTQVLADQNIPAIEAALRKGGNKQITIRRFPKANHLFQTATTGALGEYARIEETIAPEVLETIANWIPRQPPGAR